MADHIRSTLPSMATSTPTSTPAPRPRRLSLFGPPIGVLEVFAKEMAFIYQAPFLALQAAVELGTELDEPTTAEASATPTQQPPAPPAAPAPERPKPVIGTGLDWKTARDRLIAIRRQGESFTSLRDLATRVGCSEGLIRRAIKQDVGLRAWAAESKRTRRTAPAATGPAQADRMLLDWIERQGGTTTMRELTHGVRMYRGNADQATADLEKLVQAGRLVGTHVAPSRKGGRPRFEYRFSRVANTPAHRPGRGGSGTGDSGDVASNAIPEDDWGSP